MTGINDIVCACHQLVEIAREVHGAWIFTDRRQIGSSLTVQQAQFLQLVMAEKADISLSVRDQRLQLLPVRFALLNPMRGDQCGVS